MKTYIAEIAGKDSIAAVHKIMRERAPATIIPTVVYTGTEYGDFSSYTRSIDYLTKCGQVYGVSVEKTVVLHNELLWNYICAKYSNLLFREYGIYTPCVMCHLFTHLLRIPLYLERKCEGIITGERYSHKGKLKANQQQDTISLFRSLFSRHRIALIQPFIDTEDTLIVDEEINDYSHLSTINDVKCILSGNMSGVSLEEQGNLAKLRQYLHSFVSPVGEYLLQCYTKRLEIQYEELDQVIRRCLHE